MQYKNNFFHVENISTEKLSKKFKTPLYCYSYSRIKNNIRFKPLEYLCEDFDVDILEKLFINILNKK